MKKTWIKNLFVALVAVTMVGSYIPSIFLSTTVIAESLEESSGKTLIDNEYVKVKANYQVQKNTINWKIFYQRKNQSKKRNVVFSVFNGNTSLPINYISEETKASFTSNDNGQRWYQKEFNNNEKGFITFSTPKELGWSFYIHDLEEKNTEDTSYEELFSNTEVGPYELSYEEKSATSKDDLDLSEATTTKDSSTEESTTIEEETTSSTEEPKNFSPFRKASAQNDENGGKNLDLMDALTHPSRIIPENAISLAGIFDNPNVEGRGDFFDSWGILHRTGFSFDNRAVYLAGSDNKTTFFSKPEYRLDFNDDFSGKIYLSFGKNPLDGMAFVMHRDERGSGAITASSKPSSLGVYGENSADGAIKNSVAVEFDLIKDEGLDNLVNVSDSKQPYHTGYSYPADSKSYKDGSLVHKNFFDLQKAISNYNQSLLNTETGKTGKDDPKITVKWFPFNFSYSKSSGVFEYSLGTASDTVVDSYSKIISGTIQKDELFKAFGLTDSSEDKQVYWGITSAIGKGNEGNGGMNGLAIAKLPVEKLLTTSVYKNIEEEINPTESFADFKKRWWEISFLGGEDDIKSDEQIAKREDYLLFNSRYIFGNAKGKNEKKLNEWNFYWDSDLIPNTSIKDVRYYHLDVSQNPNNTGTSIWKNGNQEFEVTVNQNPDKNKSIPNLTVRKKWGTLNAQNIYYIQVIIDKNKIEKATLDEIATNLQVDPNIQGGNSILNKGRLDTKVTTRIKTTTNGTEDKELEFSSWYTFGKANPEKTGQLTLDAVPNFNFGTVDISDILKQPETSDKEKPLESNQVTENKDMDAFDGNESGLLQVTNTNNSNWKLSASMGRFRLLKDPKNNISEGFDPSQQTLSGSIIFKNLGGQEKPITVTSPEVDQEQQSAILLESNDKKEITQLTLDANSNQVFFKINPEENQPIYVGTYQTTMTWTLENIPTP